MPFAAILIIESIKCEAYQIKITIDIIDRVHTLQVICCDLPSMLRLVMRLPVRLRSNCGAGRSTGIFFVWYIVRPE